MQLHVGTSGYQYTEWRGSFYPDGLRPEEMLAYYGRRFSAVEINNTFYRLPRATVVRNWAAQVPAGFRFVLKASQRITHHARLHNVGETLAYLLEVSSELGEKRGPTLFQLPPNFKKDLARLRAFLELLPAGWAAAMEFRHPSWFDDEVYGALRDTEVALCCNDAGEGEPGTPVVPTAAFGYFRLRRESYTDAELYDWIATIRAQPWREVFVFFKHEDAGTGPKLAARFRDAWDAAHPPGAG